jgi:hypothetical protein
MESVHYYREFLKSKTNQNITEILYPSTMILNGYTVNLNNYIVKMKLLWSKLKLEWYFKTFILQSQLHLHFTNHKLLYMVD